MTVERYLRMTAGLMVLVSLVLGYFVHPAWFLLAGFVGLNLFQSAFSNWCPLMTILKKAGVPECGVPRTAEPKVDLGERIKIHIHN